MRRALVLFLLVLLTPTAARAENPARATPATTAAPASPDPFGLIVFRIGDMQGTVQDDIYVMRGAELAVQIQPWRGRDDLGRGLFAGLATAGWEGDFTSFRRMGGELGYLLQTAPLWRYVRVGASMSVTGDRWYEWHESPLPGQFSGEDWALGTRVRPFVRLWRLELSMPLETGWSFGPSASYRAHAFHVGLVLF